MKKNVSKNKHGGAYLMVLTATMLMLILVAIALTITAVSRRLTAFYAYKTGLYDLAVSGNEQVLFLLEQSWEPRSDAVKLRALLQIVSEDTVIYYNNGFRISSTYAANFQSAFIREAMAEMQTIMDSGFQRVTILFRWLQAVQSNENLTWNIHSWDINLNIISAEQELSGFYRARTIMRPHGNNDRILLRTNVRKYVDGTHGVPAEVEASIIWHRTAYREIALDAHTIYMLEALGVDFIPFTPEPGDIIFLDEFTLTMIESWRSDISQRSDPWRS